MLSGSYSTILLVITASIGNILGSILNWLLGRRIEHYRNRRWFPVSQTRLERAQAWYIRYGKWSLLLSWAPIIGDPLTVMAGVLREPLLTFTILVSVAKIARYLVLTAITLEWV